MGWLFREESLHLGLQVSFRCWGCLRDDLGCSLGGGLSSNDWFLNWGLSWGGFGNWLSGWGRLGNWLSGWSWGLLSHWLGSSWFGDWSWLGNWSSSLGNRS